MADKSLVIKNGWLNELHFVYPVLKLPTELPRKSRDVIITLKN